MPKGQATLLKNKSFLPLWLGEGVSSLGGAFGTLAISWILYELTGSPIAMGSLWLLYFLPSLVLHLGIGPYLDRWQRKPVLLVAQWIRGVLFILPLGLVWLGLLEEWMIYLVAMVGGLLQSLYVPSVQAMIPRVVSKEQLTAANAAIDGTARLMTFLGPSIGGLILFAVNAEGLLLLTTVMFFGSGVSLHLIQEHSRRRSATQKM